MKTLIIVMLIVAAVAPAQGTREFSGTITDGMCPMNDHSRMRMGATDAECAIACVDAHGATFVLFDGKDVFVLSNQGTAEKFAGKKVTVVGTLDVAARTINVDSITVQN
jgi:hypothetical protein